MVDHQLCRWQKLPPSQGRVVLMVFPKPGKPAPYPCNTTACQSTAFTGAEYFLSYMSSMAPAMGDWLRSGTLSISKFWCFCIQYCEDIMNFQSYDGLDLHLCLKGQEPSKNAGGRKRGPI